MSVFARARAVVCCVVSIAALGALVLAPAAGAAKVGSTYLALGDSLTTATIWPSRERISEHQSGELPRRVRRCLRQRVKLTHPLTVINAGARRDLRNIHQRRRSRLGSLLRWWSRGTPFPKLAESAIRQALAGRCSQRLASNPNVSPITLDIGANDVLQFLEQTCGFPATYTCTEAQVKGEYEHIAANVGNILTKLRAAAPKAQIIVIGNYNPYPTVLPAPGEIKSLARLNEALAASLRQYPGRLASPAWSRCSIRPASLAERQRKRETCPRSASLRPCVRAVRLTRLAPKQTFIPPRLGTG